MKVIIRLDDAGSKYKLPFPFLKHSLFSLGGMRGVISQQIKIRQ